MELENIVASMKVKYIQNLIEKLNNKESPLESKDSNYENLNNILEYNKNYLSSLGEERESTSNRFNALHSNVESVQTSESIRKSSNEIDSDTILNESSNDYLYKKPWTKLAGVHKIIKVKEFVSKLIISKEDDRDKLKDTLIKLINSKVLTKKDMVKYDQINGRIIGIPSLNYSNGRYFVVT